MCGEGSEILGGAKQGWGQRGPQISLQPSGQDTGRAPEVLHIRCCVPTPSWVRDFHCRFLHPPPCNRLSCPEDLVLETSTLVEGKEHVRAGSAPYWFSIASVTIPTNLEA